MRLTIAFCGQMNKIEKMIDDNKEFWKINTIKQYRSRLVIYFNFLGCDPDEYIKDGRDYQADIKKYWKTLVKEPPGTRKGSLIAIKNFLMHYNIEFKDKYWRELRRQGKGKRPVTQDIVPTNQQLRQILMHGTIRSKALFMICATSGARIDEVLHLTFDDIDLESTPSVITIPSNITKSGDARTTFITNETKKILLEWKKERKNYLKSIIGKCNFPDALESGYKVDLNDPRIFPFHYHTSMKLWHSLIKKAGYIERDKITKRYKMHIHCLRKFAKTRMTLAGVPDKVVNWIIGHEGYMPEYDRPTIQELIPYYLKTTDNLAVFDTPLDNKKIQENLKQKDEEITELNQKYNNIKLDHIQMQIDLGKALEKLKEIEKQKTQKK